MAAKHRRPGSKGARVAGAALAAVTVSAVAAATLVVVNRYWTASSDATTTSPPASRQTVPASNASASSTSASSAATPSAAQTPVPLHLVRTTPDGATRVSGAEPIVVTFDEPVAADTTLPTLSPATPGRWSQPTPTTLRFAPAAPFVPDTKVTVTLPTGMRAANGGLLAATASVSYQVADGSLLRLQQLLAELDYLPVRFTPSLPETNTARAQGEMAFDPPMGDFTMRFPSTPQPLAALWRPGELDTLTTGAVMAFENTHGLAVDGDAGPAVWSALLNDALDHTVDPHPYTWAWTTMTHPETLRIWSDGQFVFSSKANTGIAAAPTPKGSWPVFARYRSQTMQGTNPDGTKYVDPGVPYISYFHNGDAIHGFKRASYGSEQSLGCVELPYDAAAQVWNLIDYGTVVTVTS